MIYGYIRVSTDLQTTQSQRHELTQFATRGGFVIEKWIDETISGTVEVSKRKLSRLLEETSKGDTLIVAELSRLGRSLFMIMDVLSYCMKNEINVLTVKEGYVLGDNISSKVLAFAFGLSAEIERNLISQRTKAGIARLQAEGGTFGRPAGSKKSNPILKEHDQWIRSQFLAGKSQISIARALKVHRHTVMEWVRQHQIEVTQLEKKQYAPRRKRKTKPKALRSS